MTEARILFGQIAGFLGDLGRRFCVRFEKKGAWKRAFFTGELVVVGFLRSISPWWLGLL